MVENKPEKTKQEQHGLQIAAEASQCNGKPNMRAENETEAINRRQSQEEPIRCWDFSSTSTEDERWRTGRKKIDHARKDQVRRKTMQ